MVMNPGPSAQTITAPHILEIACTSHGRPLPDVLWSRSDILLFSDARISKKMDQLISSNNHTFAFLKILLSKSLVSLVDLLLLFFQQAMLIMAFTNVLLQTCMEMTQRLSA